MAPADLATIYNLNPLFAKGISGQGQTIALIEDSDIYSTEDWTNFRTTFGLSQYTNGSLTQSHPSPVSGPNNCIDPGMTGDDGEATLDVEWASAAAPSAAIELVSCGTTATFGGLIALQNLFASSAPPAVVSMSYGACESENGATSNAAYNAAYQQAVTEGISVFVSSGDNAASACSRGQSYDTYGIGVSGMASTPYNVAVGGTDFSDTYANTNNTYWSNTNTSTYGSALSYIPETPWNDSCGGFLGAKYHGYSQTYGTSGFCASSDGQPFWNTVGGSGGPSGCATGTPSQSGVAGGTCAGWAKPSWQSLVGNPSDGVRDLPDLALFASNGVWGHYYPICFSDPVEGGVSCAAVPDTWAGGGGTSFASPIMAAFQSLVNQKSGERQGNPNPTYYSLAAKEYGASGDSSCNSSLGNTISGSCTFYDITLGDTVIPCIGADCYQPSGPVGVLSTSTTSCEPANADGDCGAYIATTGWDFTSGIGSVNAANLVNNWPTSAANFSLLPSPNTMIISPGSSMKSTITITPVNKFSGGVTLSASGLPSGVTAAFSANPATSTSTLTLTVSASAIYANSHGDHYGNLGQTDKQHPHQPNVGKTELYSLCLTQRSHHCSQRQRDEHHRHHTCECIFRQCDAGCFETAGRSHRRFQPEPGHFIECPNSIGRGHGDRRVGDNNGHRNIRQPESNDDYQAEGKSWKLYLDRFAEDLDGSARQQWYQRDHDQPDRRLRSECHLQRKQGACWGDSIFQSRFGHFEEHANASRERRGSSGGDDRYHHRNVGNPGPYDNHRT